jgi:hypothetical protein
MRAQRCRHHAQANSRSLRRPASTRGWPGASGNSPGGEWRPRGRSVSSIGIGSQHPSHSDSVMAGALRAPAGQEVL